MRTLPERDLLNTVIYSTLLKGFGQARQPERVQEVWEEMKAEGIASNTVPTPAQSKMGGKAGQTAC